MLIAPAPAKDDSEPEDAYGFGDVCPSRAKHEHFCVSWPAVKEASWKTSSGVNIDLEAFSCPELERASSSSADSRPQAESIVYILAARCAAVLSKTAIRSRYVHGVESRMLPSSLSSCSDLAKTVTAPCDDHSPRRRVFGLDLPPIRPPLAFSLEDLETDDGGYLRTALSMTDDGCEGGAAGFWPEVCARPSSRSSLTSSPFVCAACRDYRSTSMSRAGRMASVRRGTLTRTSCAGGTFPGGRRCLSLGFTKTGAVATTLRNRK